MSKLEFEPFGWEWINEMEMFPKNVLIAQMLKPALIKNIEMLEALKALYNQAKILNYGITKEVLDNAKELINELK